MAIDESLVSAEQKVIGDVKTVVIGSYSQQKPSHKLMIIVLLLIAAALVLWWVGHTVLGFMHTPMGMLLIAITIFALIAYLYLRSKGIGFKSWTGGLIEVLLIIMFLVVYIGLLDSITGTVLMLAPFIIIGSVLLVGYKWYKEQTDKTFANGIIAVILAFCIAFPVYQAYVVPYTVGTPVELTIDVSRDSVGDWDAHIELNEFHFVTTMSTQFNPYVIGAVEFSSWMWTEVNSVEKAQVDITIQVETDQSIIYHESGHNVYVSVSDMETIWGVVHIPAKYEAYINVQIRIVAQVYNEDGVLATASGIYNTR